MKKDQIYLLMMRDTTSYRSQVIYAYENWNAAEAEARRMNKVYSPHSQQYFAMAMGYDRSNPVIGKVIISVLVVVLMVCGLCAPVWLGW